MNHLIKLIPFYTLLILILFSCEKEPENLFLGSWELSEFKLDCPSEGLDNLSIAAENGCMSFQGDNLCISISFSSDTEGVLSVGQGNETPSSKTFTYTRNEDPNKVSICVDAGDCTDIELINGRLLLSESDPECPAEYYLDKK